MKIVKEITGKGEVFIWVSNNEEILEKYDQKNLYLASRKLTGTTNEGYNGVFAEAASVYFFFGDFNKKFNFRNNLTDDLPFNKYIKILLKRISKVKNWIESCKKTEGNYEEF